MFCPRPIPAAIAFAVLIGAGAAAAQAPREAARAEIWDLVMGSPAGALPGVFSNFACGANGGPPSLPLEGFTDFRRCQPEAGGLREVYFRYDDELEYRAKALNMQTEMERFAGTKAYGFPVIVSALFNDRGVLRGLRLSSDARDLTRRRDDAHALRGFLIARFGSADWVCADHPPEDGESPVGRTFIKQDCRKTLGETALTLETRLFRKAGQKAFDPRTERETQGSFESRVRFEMLGRE